MGGFLRRRPSWRVLTADAVVLDHLAWRARGLLTRFAMPGDGGWHAVLNLPRVLGRLGQAQKMDITVLTVTTSQRSA